MRSFSVCFSWLLHISMWMFSVHIFPHSRIRYVLPASCFRLLGLKGTSMWITCKGGEIVLPIYKSVFIPLSLFWGNPVILSVVSNALEDLLLCFRTTRKNWRLETPPPTPAANSVLFSFCWQHGPQKLIKQATSSPHSHNLPRTPTKEMSGKGTCCNTSQVSNMPLSLLDWKKLLGQILAAGLSHGGGKKRPVTFHSTQAHTNFLSPQSFPSPSLPPS